MYHIYVVSPIKTELGRTINLMDKVVVAITGNLERIEEVNMIQDDTAETCLKILKMFGSDISTLKQESINKWH
jgi:hypothetical protein